MEPERGVPGVLVSCRRLALVASVVVVLDALYAAYAVSEGPFPALVDLGSPTAYLNLYIHVPIAWTAYLLFGLALVSGALYLARRDEKWDRLTQAFVAVGEAFGVATILTGMAWAKESWGAAWSWDPRQTGVLLLVLAYLGYFALRSSIPDPERRRLVSSAYAVAAFSMVPLSFIAAYAFESLHPSFQQARGFMKEAAPYFVPRIFLASASGVLVSVLLAKAKVEDCRCRAALAAGAVAILVGAAIAASVLAPYAAGAPARVVAAELDGEGRILSLRLSTGENVSFPEPVESPVKPAEVNGTPTITGHLVIVEGGSVRVVKHWSVAFDALVYLAMIGFLLILAASGRLRGGEA